MTRTAYQAATLAAVIASPFSAPGAMADAQPGKTYDIGLITYADSVTSDVLKEELARLGYVEGENTTYIFKHGGRDLDQMPLLAEELVASDPDLIVSMMTNAHVPIRDATAENRIPVVFWSASPQETEIVSSFRKPGGNFTGFTYEPLVELQMLRLIKLLYPETECVGHLYNRSYAPAGPVREGLEEAADLLEVRLEIGEPETPDDFEQVIGAFADAGCPGFIVGPHELFSQNPDRIVELGAQYDLAVVSMVSTILKAGGLAAFPPPFDDGWPQMARVADRLLNGERPEDIPVERGFKSNFWLNLGAARDLGIEIPPKVLDEADMVVGEDEVASD